MPAVVLDPEKLKPVTKLALDMTAHAVYHAGMALHFFTDGSYSEVAADRSQVCAWAVVVLGECSMH
eukprot:13268139-Alexandrium_andersonii.AAC.1